MRVPSMPTRNPVQTMRANPTSPSRPRQNPGGSTGPQGTPGGRARKPGVAGRAPKLGQEVYLWILVLIEIAMLGGFRKYFRRFHGG